MNGHNMIKNAVIERILDAVAAGTTQQLTSVVDMAGFDSVIFIAILGDVTDTSVLTLTMQHGDESDLSDAADTTLNATFTAGASDADNKLMIVECNRPQKRYVRGKLTRTTANAVIDGILAIKFNTNEAPVTEAAEVIASTLALAPDAA